MDISLLKYVAIHSKRRNLSPVIDSQHPQHTMPYSMRLLNDKSEKVGLNNGRIDFGPLYFLSFLI